MNLNNMVKAERISESVEANVNDLVNKLCEDESPDVRRMVWVIFCWRMAARQAGSVFFQLPDLDEL